MQNYCRSAEWRRKGRMKWWKIWSNKKSIRKMQSRMRGKQMKKRTEERRRTTEKTGQGEDNEDKRNIVMSSLCLYRKLYIGSLSWLWSEAVCFTVRVAITQLQIHINETGMIEICLLLQPTASDMHQVTARAASFTESQNTSSCGIIHHAIKHVRLFSI